MITRGTPMTMETSQSWEKDGILCFQWHLNHLFLIKLFCWSGFTAEFHGCPRPKTGIIYGNAQVFPRSSHVAPQRSRGLLKHVHGGTDLFALCEACKGHCGGWGLGVGKLLLVVVGSLYGLTSHQEILWRITKRSLSLTYHLDFCNGLAALLKWSRYASYWNVELWRFRPELGFWCFDFSTAVIDPPCAGQYPDHDSECRDPQRHPKSLISRVLGS